MQLTQKDGTLFLQGVVTLSTVTQLSQQSLLQACAQPIEVVDLSEVTQADSACVAVLLLLKRQLVQGSWQLRAVPTAVTALLGLYELEWLA